MDDAAGGGSGAGGNTLKLRSKNYASPDCGAKIVAANPEAVSAGAVLSSSRDEYMLNTCTSRIWFVVELCEAIQAKKIELANFELFSSTPRDFAVWVSDRVAGAAGREWQPVGRFTATDERAIQSFVLSPQPFGRYVKVEILSHHGSEHFCPVSLLRVYGTSEFEVLETVDEAADGDGPAAARLGAADDDDDEDEPLDEGPLLNVAGGPPGGPPRNLFDSAKDAVLSIVKKAAQALGKGGDSSNETALNASSADSATGAGEAIAEPMPNDDADDASTPSPADDAPLCKCPRHLVVCDNCSDALFGDVYQLLSCRGRYLESLLASAFVENDLRESKICERFGLFLPTRRAGAPYPLRAPPLRASAAVEPAHPAEYLSALLPEATIAALCNVLAVCEKKVALNISHQLNATAAGSEDAASASLPPTSPLEKGLEQALPPATCTLDASAGSAQCHGEGTPCPPGDVPTEELPLASQIKPTKTLDKEEKGDDTSPPPPPPSLESSMAPSAKVTETQPPAVVDTAAGAVPKIVATAAPREKNLTEAAPTAGKDASADSAPAADASAEADPSAESAEHSTEAPEEPVGDNLETLLRDLKDLDQSGETVGAGSAPAGPATSSPPPPATSSSPSAPAAASPKAPAQKESVFLRLANRIKALERNMSLSGQYLEELSRRYKKQMEEMQRAFNRTLQAVHDANRVGEERETKRQEEMQQLQQHLLVLTETVQTLMGERDSWLYHISVITQHVILISVEILVFILLMYFCRRLPRNDPPPINEDTRRKLSVGNRNKKGSKTAVKRRKSVDGVLGHESPRTRRRRPSEEALNIAGTYRDLLITDPSVSEIDGSAPLSKADARRRRRKKKDVMRSASVSVRPTEGSSRGIEELPSRRASAMESVGMWWTASNGVSVNDIEEGVESVEVKPLLLHQQSAPEPLCNSDSPPSESYTTPIGTPLEPTISILMKPRENTQFRSASGSASEPKQIETLTKQRSASDTRPPQNNGVGKSNTSTTPLQRQLQSPMFMRTASSMRSSRLNSSAEPSPPAKLKSDNWEWYSAHHSKDKSSQPSKVTCSASQETSGIQNQRQNGHSSNEERRRNSNASSNASSASNKSEGGSRKDSSKKGPTGLKRMVKKFF